MQNVLFHFITEKVLYIRNTINKKFYTKLKNRKIFEKSC